MSRIISATLFHLLIVFIFTSGTITTTTAFVQPSSLHSPYFNHLAATKQQSSSSCRRRRSTTRYQTVNDESDNNNTKRVMEQKQQQQQQSNNNDPKIPKPGKGPETERLGEYDPRERLPGRKTDVLVGEPPIKKQKEMSVSSILKELAAIQAQGPQKYCVLGTRHCSYLHQQIIELLAYALVLSGNHVYTSGAGGTHAATIRGALRAERPDLLTVVLPQSLYKQPKESQELLKDVTDLVTMPQNDELTLDVASRICNSFLLSQTDQLVSFAFHESRTVIEATKEARELDMLVTTLFLD